ncbi:integral membrane protein S linking to the trans Golgi network-domain-containing protein, partial [Thamnocephalis sphaerospora]
SSGAKFRASVWDPWLILSQIAAMQSCYYTLLCLATLLMEAFSGQETALAHVLDYRVYRGDTVFGWTLGLGVMGCAAVSVLLLLRIVERARLCLDYVVTLHFLHLIFTSYYSGHLPTTVFWWALNLASCCAMSIGGEWVCMRREMEPIMLS